MLDRTFDSQNQQSTMPIDKKYLDKCQEIFQWIILQNFKDLDNKNSSLDAYTDLTLQFHQKLSNVLLEVSMKARNMITLKKQQKNESAKLGDELFDQENILLAQKEGTRLQQVSVQRKQRQVNQDLKGEKYIQLRKNLFGEHQSFLSYSSSSKNKNQGQNSSNETLLLEKSSINRFDQGYRSGKQTPERQQRESPSKVNISSISQNSPIKKKEIQGAEKGPQEKRIGITFKQQLPEANVTRNMLMKMLKTNVIDSMSTKRPEIIVHQNVQKAENPLSLNARQGLKRISFTYK